jgi:hypothetical protein
MFDPRAGLATNIATDRSQSGNAVKSKNLLQNVAERRREELRQERIDTEDPQGIMLPNGLI